MIEFQPDHGTPLGAPIAATSLSGIAALRHGFFPRPFFVADGAGALSENRARMAGFFRQPSAHVLQLYQVHSADVVHVTQPDSHAAEDKEQRPRADAMVTATPDLALTIATADCGPLLFADAEAGIVGAAHAGWRGAFGGIFEATVTAMERLGASRNRIVAALGPTISGPAYEVGPEVVALFRDKDADWVRFFQPTDRTGHALFDLPAFIASRAAAAKVGHFEDLRLCTYADEERFHSYRRATHRNQKNDGRLMAGIMLRSSPP